jgi:NADPH:quinone reductase-like Zn-dependent oxidoreductase
LDRYTSGRYFGGVKAATAMLPFDAGFESVGVVAAVGPGVEGLRPGQPVATTTYGGFSEYAVAPWKMCVPVPEVGGLYTLRMQLTLSLKAPGSNP